ncbi:hypothetical protein JCM10213_002289 [Rhodosporidiobolus nylandii]
MPSTSSGNAKKAASPAIGGRQARSAKDEDGQARGRRGGQGEEGGDGAAATPASETASEPASSPCADHPSSPQAAAGAANAAPPKAEKAHKEVWSSADERALVASVKERGPRNWPLVVKDLQEKGCKRSEHSAEQHYSILRARAEAQGVLLDGPVPLTPWMIDEEGKLLALGQLVDECAASDGKTRRSISWSKFLSAFPRRAAPDLSGKLGNLKQLIKGNSRKPSRVKELKEKKEDALEELKKQFPELAGGAVKASGEAVEPKEKKQDKSKARDVVSESPVADATSSLASPSQRAPTPSTHSFRASDTRYTLSSPISDSPTMPSSLLPSESSVATPVAVNGGGEVGRSSFSPSPDPLPTPKQPAYLSQPADTSFSTASTSAAPLQPHRNSASSARLPSPSALALFGTASAVPSTSSQLSSAGRGKKRMREVGDIFEEAKRLCRRAAEALSEEIEDW